MSTRSTKVLIKRKDISLHLYSEMHDQMTHLELIRLHEGSETNEMINIALPDGVAKGLWEILKPLDDPEANQIL